MSRYSKDHSEESRARLVNSSTREFLEHGFGGIGVDGLAKSAGLTSGAFYSHFASKADAFTLALENGLQELELNLERLHKEQKGQWLEVFARIYMNEKRLCEPGQSCALGLLPAEAERVGEPAKEVFERYLTRIIEMILEDGPGDTERRANVIALLSLLVGGLNLSRAVVAPELSKEIADSTLTAALALIAKIKAH